jgi:hypothetical protein
MTTLLPQELVTGVQSFALYNAGMLSLEQQDASIDEEFTASNLEAFRRLHTDLMDEIGSSSEEHLLYSSESIPQADLVDGTFVDWSTYETAVSNISMSRAGLKVVSAVTEILTLPLQNRSFTDVNMVSGCPLANSCRCCDDTLLCLCVTNMRWEKASYVHRFNPATGRPQASRCRDVSKRYCCPILVVGVQFYMMFNGIGELRQALNLSTVLADKRSSTQAALIDTANLAVLLGTVLVIIALIVTVIFTAVRKVVTDKGVVYDAYLNVPVEVVKQLRQQAFQRNEAFRREDDAVFSIDAINISVAAGPPGVDDLSGRVASTQNTVAGPSGFAAVAAPHGSGEQRAGLSRFGISRAAPNSKHREFVNRKSSWLLLVISLLWPLLVYIGYFCGLYVWVGSAVNESRFARAEIFWSKQVEVLMPAINLHSRALASNCDAAEVRRRLISQMDTDIHFADMIEQALIAGSSSYLFRPAIEISQELMDLYVVNGCVDTEDANYAADDCQTHFESGLVGRGLEPGWQRFVDYSLRILRTYVTFIHASCMQIVKRYFTTGIVCTSAAWIRASATRKAAAMDTPDW